MDRLWQVLLRVAAEESEELSCEDCFILLDYLSDLLAGGFPPREVLPLAQNYLKRCPDCQQEFRQALMEFVLARPDADATDPTLSARQG
jgi:hypothetical protein